MQSHDLRCESSVENPDLVTMSDEASTPTHHRDEPQDQQEHPESSNRGTGNEINHSSSNNGDSVAKKRPSRACTQRGAARLQAAVAEEAAAAAAERKSRAAKKDRFRERSPEPSPPPEPHCKIITPLTVEPPEPLLPRWGIRSMWEFASILNFLNVFRPLLNITVEFSAEELETALLTPNNTLADVHMPLLKVIPPITRMALGHNTWITVLCRKLRDWWHWVAEGELPVVASHGAEVETYNTLDPGIRVVILKALCDIRVEQEDIRSYIDNSIKRGVQLSAFRKERIGGDSYGISYWYEEDPIIGHRLYREIRQVEVKKVKGRNVQSIPSSSYQWETVATNLEEFQDVSDKLSSSENRTESSVGKKLKVNMLPEIEKIQKTKEKLLKKQQREALLLDNMMGVDGLVAGRSRRDRKRVTYTFDDYERSITEAIKTEQTKPSPELNFRREIPVKPDASMNVRWLRVIGPSHPHQKNSSDAPSLKSFDHNGTVMDQKPEILDRSNRQRRRPRRYSTDEFVEAVSDIEADVGSDDDVVGEVEYDEDYLRQRKQKKKMSNGSDGDEEYHWDENNLKEKEPEDDESADSLSEGSDEPRRRRKLPSFNRRTKLKSIHQLESSPRRSQRASRTSFNFKQFELSEPEAELKKHVMFNASGEDIYSYNREVPIGKRDLIHHEDNEVKDVDQPTNELPETVGKEENGLLDNSNIPGQDVSGAAKEARFLDLNETSYTSQFTERVQHNDER